jgi:hypothetical protein
MRAGSSSTWGSVGREADHEDPALGGERPQRLVEEPVAERVEHRVQPAPTGQLADPRREATVQDDNVGGTGGPCRGHLVLVGDAGHDPGAEPERHLDRRRPDTATRAHHQHRLSGLHPSAPEERESTVW